MRERTTAASLGLWVCIGAAGCGARSGLDTVTGTAPPDAGLLDAGPLDATQPEAAACLPGCAGQACGASDGCGGTCRQGTCRVGLHCAFPGMCVCDPSSCSGCCSGGSCLAGTGSVACGAGGGQCMACPGSTTCTAGRCAGPTCVAASCAGGLHCGSDGSCVCDSTSCTGCCAAGQCLAGSDPRVCGARGVGCTVCAPSESCTAGQCVAPTRILLFGGNDESTGDFGDTWEWDGNRWTERAVSGGPSPRSGASMGSLAGKVVLFGGIHYVPILDYPFDDTWEWDGNAWTQRMVAGPPPRYFAAIATLGSKVVLYGGIGTVQGPDGGDVLYNDTWEWDGNAWTQRMVAGPTNPFRIPSMTTVDNKLILVGDIDNTLPPPMWQWDGNVWTQLHPATPLPTVLTYTTDPIVTSVGAGAVAIAFVARYAPTATYTWDGLNWTSRMIAGPQSRDLASMVTLAGQAVLFGGGETAGGPVLSDTWQWDGNTWTRRNVTGPSGRWQAAMAAY